MIRVSVILMSMCLCAAAQVKPAYQLFTKEGKPASYDKMINDITQADIILFGELHDNSINHWLELQVTKDVYAAVHSLTLGLEMFESDDQLVLNEYLEGTIEERHLLSEAKVWDNYKTDYKPLVDFGRTNTLKVIATNIPRRYANLVFRKGIESLSTLPAEASQWIAPLPIEIDLNLPGYKSMMAVDGHQSGGNENMAKSQAVKDATMAHFILKNNAKPFLHFHGAYHSKNFEGMYWY